MEINVGDYVRTKYYGISKIVYLYDNGEIEIETKKECLIIDKDRIQKASNNIIDLIKIGDYINRHKVRAVYLNGENHYIKLSNSGKKGIRTYEENIKSIVTKEQFEANAYVLEKER